MKHLEELKKKIDRELEDLSKKPISMDTINKVHVMTDTIKNIDKICLLAEDEEEGYSEARGRRGRRGYSRAADLETMAMYDDDASYARGRGRNARRDSMGRYSREGGYSEDMYSEEGGSSYARGGRGMGGYSRGDAKEHLMEKIEEMMENADPKDKKALMECMRTLERA